MAVSEPHDAGPPGAPRPVSPNHRKYLSRNPIKRRLIANLFSTILDAIDRSRPESILEVGCGEGFMTRAIRDRFPGVPLTAVDASEEALEVARVQNPDVAFRCQDVERLDLEDAGYDLVLCAEVLEHLPRSETALRELCRVSRRRLVLSVPNEPYLRMANFAVLNHFRSLGNPPGHVRHWSTGAFVDEVSPLVRVESVFRPFPWSVVVGGKR
jgi:2-polyprenyl-3-methyl-5-hydroxy-6-metoxy-1,4-benzoquinol methylase